MLRRLPPTSFDDAPHTDDADDDDDADADDADADDADDADEADSQPAAEEQRVEELDTILDGVLKDESED
jgi:hypothetical protein